MHNPSLRTEPRSQKATVVPLRESASILDWLESSGRLISRDTQEREASSRDEEDEEINELMGSDNATFDEEEESDQE